MNKVFCNSTTIVLIMCQPILSNEVNVFQYHVIELMYIVFVPFDWIRSLYPNCFCSVHNSINFRAPELLFVYTQPWKAMVTWWWWGSRWTMTKYGKDSHYIIYSVCECIGTVYTRMKSWKDPFDPILCFCLFLLDW